MEHRASFYVKILDEVFDDNSATTDAFFNRCIWNIRDEMNSDVLDSPFDSLNLRDAQPRMVAALRGVYSMGRQHWHATAKVTFGGYAQGVSVVAHIAADHPADATETKIVVTLIASVRRIK